MSDTSDVYSKYAIGISIIAILLSGASFAYSIYIDSKSSSNAAYRLDVQKTIIEVRLRTSERLCGAMPESCERLNQLFEADLAKYVEYVESEKAHLDGETYESIVTDIIDYELRSSEALALGLSNNIIESEDKDK
ncbi:MAG: hypothetical protein AB8B89_10470 [Gammaproteobacteria bacterium]